MATSVPPLAYTQKVQLIFIGLIAISLPLVGLQITRPIILTSHASTVTPSGKCIITGCANHLCLDQSITPYAPATCPDIPELTCLAHSSCQLQVDGRCGWTITKETQICIDSYR